MKLNYKHFSNIPKPIINEETKEHYNRSIHCMEKNLNKINNFFSDF